MRTVLGLAVALALLSAPLASGGRVEVQGPTGVMIYRAGDGHALLAWLPSPGATHYTVDRGTDPDRMVRVQEGPEPAYYDPADVPAGVTVYYTISAVDASGHVQATHVDTRSEGDCVSVAGNLAVSVTASNCLTLVRGL